MYEIATIKNTAMGIIGAFFFIFILLPWLVVVYYFEASLFLPLANANLLAWRRIFYRDSDLSLARNQTCFPEAVRPLLSQHQIVDPELCTPEQAIDFVNDFFSSEIEEIPNEKQFETFMKLYDTLLRKTVFSQRSNIRLSYKYDLQENMFLVRMARDRLDGYMDIGRFWQVEKLDRLAYAKLFNIPLACLDHNFNIIEVESRLMSTHNKVTGIKRMLREKMDFALPPVQFQCLWNLLLISSKEGDKFVAIINLCHDAFRKAFFKFAFDAIFQAFINDTEDLLRCVLLAVFKISSISTDYIHDPEEIECFKSPENKITSWNKLVNVVNKFSIFKYSEEAKCLPAVEKKAYYSEQFVDSLTLSQNSGS